jgi:hypothetical protein
VTVHHTANAGRDCRARGRQIFKSWPSDRRRHPPQITAAKIASNSSFGGDVISRCTLPTTMIASATNVYRFLGSKVGNLHHFWGTEFVDQLGSEARSIASDLIGHISLQNPGAGLVTNNPGRLGLGVTKMARNDAYGQLPEAETRGTYRLTDDYISIATQDAAVQLSKGGVRPADILNKVLGRPR